MIDYCTLLENPIAPTGSVVAGDVYERADGIKYRGLIQDEVFSHEIVRLTNDAFLLATDFAPRADEVHKQIITQSDWVHIQFRCNGGGAESVSHQQVNTPEDACIITRYPRGAVVERQIPRTERWRYACLFMTPEALGKLLDLSPGDLPEEASWLLSESSQTFNFTALRLQSDMTVAVHDILMCPYRGQSRRAYMRGKALELLAIVLNTLATPMPMVRSLRLSHADKGRIAAAKEIMDKELERNLTLAALARRVGLNRTKLALGFRDNYGTSVQAYWRDAKLFHARDVLRRGERSVTEVALSLGYGELSSFTRAFTKKFGVLPRDCRWLAS